MRPLPSLPLRRAVLPAALLSALAVPAGASAAGTVKVPVPAPGQVAVAAAPLTGAATPVAPRRVPAGTVVTGGRVGRVALVAVIRPDDGGKPGKGTVRVALRGRGRPAKGAASTARAFGEAPAAALTAAVRPACSRAAAALGRALRHSGSDGLGAGDLKKVAKALAARLCGGKVDAKALADAGLAAPAADPAGTPGGSPGAGVGGASGAPSARPPAGGGSPSTPGAGGSNNNNNNGSSGGDGKPQCSNGKDDDGDGQVDALSQGTQFFDPGCDGPNDTTESSEKPTPRQCGIGVYLNSSTSFGVDFDSMSFDDCPKQMSRGVVDLAQLVTDCHDTGFEGQAGGSCDAGSGNVVVTGGPGNQWQVQGTAMGSLCGTRAVIVGYTPDGQAWEQDRPVVDGNDVCGGGGGQPGAKQCANGIDDDGDGQVDAAGGAGKGPDPGCTGADDDTEASETSFPNTGCLPVVASDPNDATIAYVYVIRSANGTCPTISEEWISFDDVEVQSCDSDPYWDGAAAGQCAVSGGDAHLTGASGTRSLIVLKLSGPVDCQVKGQIDERDAQSIGEAAMLGGYFDADNNNALTLC